jgi:hypothetical protein
MPPIKLLHYCVTEPSQKGRAINPGHINLGFAHYVRHLLSALKNPITDMRPAAHYFQVVG